MRDHFDMEIFVGDKVLTAQLGGAGTTYKIGTIVKLYDESAHNKKVRVKFPKQKCGWREMNEHHGVCYAQNVVVIRDINGITI